jgi:hypothetical protein
VISKISFPTAKKSPTEKPNDIFAPNSYHEKKIMAHAVPVINSMVREEGDREGKYNPISFLP